MNHKIQNYYYILLMILLFTSLAFYSPQEQGVIILFEDDFQDGQPDDWEITAAWYVQQAGDLYTFEASGAGGAWVPDGGGWSNYAFRSFVQVDAGALLLSFNLTEQGRYMVRIDEYGLYLVKEYPADEFNVISQTGPLPDTSWHYLALGSYDNQVQVYVDQELWIDYQDAEPLAGGTIAVASLDGSQVAVDNVLVTQLTKPLPAGEIKAPPALQAPLPDVQAEAESGLSLDQVDEIVEGQDQAPEVQSGTPDLVITNASFDPDPVVSGQLFTANYAIENVGDAPAGAFTLLWEFHAATGIGVCSWDYFGLAPGEAVWGGCQRVTNAQPGESPTVLTVDFEGEIAESNEGNNQMTPTLRVGTVAQDSGGEAEPSGEAEQSAGQPDLVILEAYFDPDPVIQGQQFVANYAIANHGDAPSGAFTLLWKFHENTGVGVCSWDYAGLAPGEAVWGGCVKTTNAPAKGYRSTLTVDFENEIQESDENNQRVVTLTVRKE